MRLRILLSVALLATGCAHKRIPASAGDDLTVQSGVPASFAGPVELPEGTKVLWDFGDGSPPVTAPSAEHAFPRAGTFTVTQTVQDADGDKRSATAKVLVLRRAVPLAVPPDVNAVLLAQWPWARVSLQRDVAARLGLRDFYEELARGMSDAAGFDVTSAEAAAANGFDPDEGLAIFTVPQDSEALVVAVGVSDEAKAEQALRHLLNRDQTAQNPALGPFQLSEAKLDGGLRAVAGSRNAGAEKVAYAFKYGYLYLRTPGATDPLLALGGVAALTPDKGLERDPGYLAAVRRIGPGDFVFYSAGRQDKPWGGPGPSVPGKDGEAPARTGPLSRTIQQLGASAFALNLKADRLEMRLFGQLKNLTGEKLQAAFTPVKPPPDLAALLPAGAVAYAKISGSPAALWREVKRAAGDSKESMEAQLHAVLGGDAEQQLLPLFTGNAGAAFYLDAAALLEAVLGEQVASFDRSTLLVAIEVAEGKGDEVRAVLDRLVKKLGEDGRLTRQTVAGNVLWRATHGALLAAQKGNTLFVAIGGSHDGDAPQAAQEGAADAAGEEQSLSPTQKGPLGALEQVLHPGKRMLTDQLKHAGVRGFDLPTDQLGYLDVALALRQIERAANAQGGAAGLATGLMIDRVRGLRDALLEARPTPDGVEAQLTVRFRAAAKASGR